MSNLKVRFTPTGRLQFLAALAYIKSDNPTAAKNFRDKAEGMLRRLEDFPNSGRHLPEFSDLPYREAIVPPYRFFYREKGGTIWIVGVWHSAQIPEPPEH